MTASNNPTGGNSLSFDEPSFPLDSNNSGISLASARAFSFAPPAAPEQPAQAAVESPPQPASEPVQPEFNLLQQLQKATNPDAPDAQLPAVSKEELSSLVETFVRVVRGEVMDNGAELENRNTEIAQLKELLLEAQETIISLLNDRVFDRAKISKLESEVRLLPDMQSQANRAMGLAMRSEDVQKELLEVRAEVERLRTAYMRQDSGFFGWLFGKKTSP